MQRSEDCAVDTMTLTCPLCCLLWAPHWAWQLPVLGSPGRREAGEEMA